jgi:hypothetical protein
MWRDILALLTTLYFCVTCFGDEPKSEPVNLCTLAENIQAYKEQHVRLKAFLRITYENSFLYDPKCRNGEPLVDFEIKSNADGKLELLRKVLRDKGLAYVTVEGVVHGPEPVHRDPKLPDWINDLYKNSVKKYGHLNAYGMQIEVEHILDVNKVEDK